MTRTMESSQVLQVNIGPERKFMPGGLQPFMVRAADGRLYAIGQLPVPLGTHFPGVFGACVSDDAGKTWQKWSQADLPGGSVFFEGCATVLKRDNNALIMLPHSFKAAQPEGWWEAPLWESRDNWRTVRRATTARLHLPQAKGGFDDDGHKAPEVFLHRTLLELPSGELLLTGYGWFKGDEIPSTYRPTMNKFRTLLFHSSDKGRTWSLRATVAYGDVGEEAFNEPVMVRISKGPNAGRLLVHMRTGSNKTFRHNPIHQSHSDDEGRTWSSPQPLPFCGNVDPELIEMSDGTLVSGFGYRTFESRVNLTSEPKTMGKGHGNYIAFSTDHGQTWIQETQVTDDPSTCYVAIAETSPGKLAYVYDIGDAWQHVWIGNEGIERGLGCREIEVRRST